MSTGATHLPNITVPVTLGTAPRQVAGFGTTLLLVALASNSLNGDRMRTYTSYEDAVDDNTAGYISASTLAAAEVAFSQRPKPAEFKVGYVDLATSVAGVKASKDFGAVGTGAFDTVIEAHTAGTDGNAITVELVGDLSSGTCTITRSGNAFVLHIWPSHTTVTDVESAIAALAGADDLIDVKTAGTGATVLAVADCNMAATALAGGVDVVTVETYSTALTACIAFDDDFYGVCIDSRVAATITAFGATVEALSKKLLFAVQNASATWLTGALPGGITGGRERTIFCYHDTDAEWMDVAYLVSRLVYDPDVLSAPWALGSLAAVASYATAPTAAQRLLAIATPCYANLGLPFGGADFAIDPGKNSNGRPIYEMVTADWFATRLVERVAALKLARSNRGQKLAVTPTGQATVLAVIEGLYAQAVAAGHFVAPSQDDVPIEVPTITDADRTAQRLRFTVRAQIAVDGRIFSFPCNFSTDALSA